MSIYGEFAYRDPVYLQCLLSAVNMVHLNQRSHIDEPNEPVHHVYIPMKDSVSGMSTDKENGCVRRDTENMQNQLGRGSSRFLNARNRDWATKQSLHWLDGDYVNGKGRIYTGLPNQQEGFSKVVTW